MIKCFVDWLDDPIGQKERYFRNGAQETITSFLGQVQLDDISDSTYKAWAKEIIESNEELISFMKELPLFYEINDIIFVHAGINPEHNDWKMTNEHEMVWIRDPFLQADLHSIKPLFMDIHQQSIYMIKRIFFMEIRKSASMVLVFMVIS